MTPYYADDLVTLHHGDCLEVLATLPGASLDAVVCDPPYNLGFMGKKWDSPGKAFVERKADHRNTWDHVGGNHNPANSADQARTQRVEGQRFQAWCEAWAAECLRVLKPGGHLLAFGGTRTYHRLACGIEDAGFEVRDSLHWIYGSGFPKSLDVGKAMGNAAMASSAPEAQKREGWGTALKPAHEPVVVARSPLAGSVAVNVAEHGTGALNIGGCRIATPDGLGRTRNTALGVMNDDGWRPQQQASAGDAAGRWPPNVLLTHAADCGGQCAPDCPVAELDAQSGTSTSSGGHGEASLRTTLGGAVYGEYSHAKLGRNAGGLGDTGGASRFFPVFRYQPKAPRGERPRLDDGTAHPTVKPLALMQWLVRLVTPPGGVVLDPFTGTGTTLQAARREGFPAIGIEADDRYCQLAARRLAQGVLTEQPPA